MRAFIHRPQQQTSPDATRREQASRTTPLQRRADPSSTVTFVAGRQESARSSHDFSQIPVHPSQIPVHPKSSANVRSKLRVSPPGDIYGEEADRVSEQVMRMPDLQLQRACACGGKSGERECDACKLSRKASGESVGSARVPGVVAEVLRSSGRPLDAATRTSMDTRFQFDFSRVRIHDDAQAAESASAVSALSYTVGRHIVFGPGQYSPATAAGRRLLAHELTHVVQQHASSLAAAQPFTIGSANSPAEREADAIADAVAADPLLPSISESSAARLHRSRLPGTDKNERILDLGSREELACCDSNACMNDKEGFECPDNFDCAKSGGKNKPFSKTGHKFVPKLKCDPECSKDFKPSYSGEELVVALPSGRQHKGKDHCGQKLGLCANGNSTEVTIRESSNHNTWEASPGVAKALGVSPRLPRIDLCRGRRSGHEG